MADILKGNLNINKLDWSDSDNRPYIDTDIFIWDKIEQRFELSLYIRSFDKMFNDATNLDKTKVFPIPDAIKKAKGEYRNYGDIDSITYTSGNASMSVDLDTWIIHKLNMPLNTIFREATDLVDGDEIADERKISVLMDFIGEIQFKSKNKIILPNPILKSDGTLDLQQTYSPFISVAVSTTILKTYIKFIIVSQDIDEHIAIQNLEDKWKSMLNSIVTKPRTYVVQDYIFGSVQEAKTLQRLQRPRGINF